MNMSTGAANPLDYLFKLSTQRKIPAPVFSQVVEEGPPHMKTFVWRCTFMKITAEGQGRSKKEAKTAAARAIKAGLDPDVLPPEVPSANNRKRKTEKPVSNSVMNATSSPKKRKKFEIMAKGGGPFGGPVFGPPIPPFPPMFRGKMTLDDHYVITKHKLIYPKDEELQAILKLVSHTEEALRGCSDIMAEAKAKEAKGSDEVTEEDKEGHREIMGVARVGELAKGLLLSSDRAVNVVVMCKEKPTSRSLKALAEAMTPKLKEISSEDDYQIHIFEEEGGFCVVSATESDLPYAVNVTLTSSKLRENKEEDASNVNGEQKEEKEEEEEEEVEETSEDPPDMLPRKKCEQALAELRRSNWFSTMAAGLPSCVECIRVIKEMSNRDPSWNHLSDWAIELLVERSLFSAHQPLSPAASLLRVLEVISSGIFLNGGSGLKDPCEREEVDASANMTPQQREDLTFSAQHFIRLITYRQIHKVLGMDKLPPREKRNKHHSKNGNDNSVQDHQQLS